VRDAEIADLGFGSTVKYSGLSVIRGALDRPAAGSFIANSKIARIKRISVQAAEGLVIDGNRIEDAGSAALVILHSRDTRVTANLLAGRSVTNAIRVLDGSSGTVLAGNAILEGDRVGILIKNAPDRTRVEGNIVWARDGSGIKLDRARCARVSGNYVIGNRQKGIEVRHSLAAHLDGNILVSNKSAGIWVSGQPAGAVTRIEDNVLDANGAGVATATAEAILLEGNDFTRQFPRFLAGDLGRQARYIASDITGRAPIALDAAGLVRIADLPSHCGQEG
jgi:poly(beta-D-mannuronate) C5 epimerase